MPRIFDNIEQPLLDALLETLHVAHRADFCVGYFNLRGWKKLDEGVERWAGGDGQCCRLLVGMQRLPQDDLQSLFRIDPDADGIDNATAIRLKKDLVSNSVRLTSCFLDERVGAEHFFLIPAIFLVRTARFLRLILRSCYGPLGGEPHGAATPR